ncbi:hypothetical protein HQ529_03850 [Candidatus Woesearchaeota archaeon]|nr:hypothetical protein [Candidatus Woesearchaeota archaeon]
MALIYESENFIVEALEKPHVCRTEGGHIKITPKIRICDRTKLNSKLATELMKLSMIIGESMTIGMNNCGVDIGRINYQDNGNWSVFKSEGPYLHLHLYGRAKSAKINKYGNAIKAPHRKTGFYDDFKPLNEKDVKEIRRQIELILERDKYKEWNY